MSDSQHLMVQPTPPVRAAAPVQPVRAQSPVGPGTRDHADDAAATTGGNLRAAYAQFVVDPDTHQVVVRIRDASTDEVLQEMPSPEVQEMTKYLQNYAETLARHRAALHGRATV